MDSTSGLPLETSAPNRADAARANTVPAPGKTCRSNVFDVLSRSVWVMFVFAGSLLSV
jgi:hypothetical protein